MQILPLFSAEEVESRVNALGKQLYRDYADSPIAIVCIAEGAKRFVEAIGEHLEASNVHPEVHYVRASRTAGTSGAGPGAVQVDSFDPTALEDRDVLVVDDVADEGSTLRAVLELIELAETRTVRTAVLVDKHGSRREAIRLDYVGFQVETGWVVGYGMDVDGEFRDLDEIGVVQR